MFNFSLQDQSIFRQTGVENKEIIYQWSGLKILRNYENYDLENCIAFCSEG